MHDTNLEERLRSALRQDGDGLSLTITTEELERRLALRRRARTGQRLSLMAAGLTVLAVGTMFALSTGWLRGPNVAADPSPSPASTADPSAPASAASPKPSATARVVNPVGAVDEAVLVTPLGDDSRRPEAFQITTFHPGTGVSALVATIPGSVIPDDGWLDLDGPPQISATGWLAIPFRRGPNEDDDSPAIAIVDSRASGTAPWILDGYTAMAWDPTDKLVLARDGAVSIARPNSKTLQSFVIGGTARLAFSGRGIATRPAIAVHDGARFLATSDNGPVEPQAWGFLGVDGTFTPTNDLPPMYQRSGRERTAGAGAHGLGAACDGGGASDGGGCWIIETDAGQVPVATWHDLDQTGAHDFVWASDGRTVWMLLDGGTERGTTVASLVYAPDIDTRVERARIDFDHGARPQILGFADERTPGSATVVAIGDAEGFVHAYVLEDGEVVLPDGRAWFAGWAVDPPPYDPD